MKTYVINLERCPERKEHMKELLKPYSSLEVEFINAIDGKKLTADDKINYFDNELAYKRYGKRLTDGEIGCTLSHQKCYRTLCNSDSDFALILEDDLLINNKDIENVLLDVAKYMESQEPMILLLSGDYWWIRKERLNDDFCISTVFDAICTQSYVINKAAAELIITDRPYFWADDWKLLTSKVKFRALFPHIIDQDRLEFESVIALDSWGINRRNIGIFRNLYYYYISILHKLLRKLGHFESKSFKFKYID